MMAALGSGFVVDACSHPGTTRARNEDAILDHPDAGLWVVADGAGGHALGDVASRAVVEALARLPANLAAAELLSRTRLTLAEVHRDLQQRAAALGDGRMMATTVVALMISGGHFACLWAGDSRIYLYRDGRLARLTRDHSLVQALVDSGQLAEDQAESDPRANIILRAVGAEGELEIDKVTGHLLPNDVFLLCSDGLFKALAEPDIQAVLHNGGGASALVEGALARQARDNVSVITLSRKTAIA